MSIEERYTKDGEKHYRAVVRVFRRKVSKTFERKWDAEKWEREKLSERNSPELLNCPTVLSLTIDRFFERFASDYMAVRLEVSTQVMNESVYRNHIQPFLGKELLRDMTTRKVREYLLYLSTQRKLSNERVNRVRRLLHCMCNRAVEWELLARNVVTQIKQLPSKQYIGDGDINYLHQNEVQTLLGWLQLNDPWLYPKVRVMVNTGIRYGEMRALRTGDFRQSSPSSVLNVGRTYCRILGLAKDKTKVNRGRSILLGKGMDELLISLSKGRDPELPLLWVNDEEGRHQTKFNKHFHKALKAAKVRRVRVHDLRHTFAVHFLENGGQLYDLQKLLGHSSIVLTERYSHFSSVMLERSKGLVDHHGSPRRLQPQLTVIDGGSR